MRILNRFAILGFLLLSTCAPVPAQVPQTGSSNQPVSGRSPIQVLKVAQIGMPASMTPESAEHSKPIYWMMYDNIVTLDSSFKVVPSAAER